MSREGGLRREVLLLSSVSGISALMPSEFVKLLASVGIYSQNGRGHGDDQEGAKSKRFGALIPDKNL